MRNVLQMVDRFQQGGSERQTVQLTRLLVESGRYRVHIACLKDTGPLRVELDVIGFRHVPSFPLTSFYDRNAQFQLRRFVRFLREREIDLIHTHDFYTNIFGMAGAALARVPARIASRRETDGIRSRAQRFIERRSYSLADAIVANAEAVRTQLVKEGIAPEKIVTVYNGLDLARLTPRMLPHEARRVLGLPSEEDCRLVTIVANMFHAMKDQATFLRAARRVSEAVPGTAFALAGEGQQLESLRALSRQLGIERNTFFLGRCSHVPELLSITDVCVLSSCGVEGFSNSILEYMAAGCPVVATEIGGAREAVVHGETGYIVGAGDDERMANHIIELLRNPDRAKEMGGRGKKIVEERFSCASQLEQTRNLYERLFSNKTIAKHTSRVEHQQSA
jgi:L-malate glycosyltransferase